MAKKNFRHVRNERFPFEQAQRKKGNPEPVNGYDIFNDTWVKMKNGIAFPV